MAAALALLDLPPSTEHPLPPLECLFTVDEETGLTGAFDLDPTLLSGMPLVQPTLILRMSSGCIQLLQAAVALTLLEGMQCILRISCCMCGACVSPGL